jgi:hypothetical protein
MCYYQAYCLNYEERHYDDMRHKNRDVLEEIFRRKHQPSRTNIVYDKKLVHFSHGEQRHLKT